MGASRALAKQDEETEAGQAGKTPSQKNSFTIDFLKERGYFQFS